MANTIPVNDPQALPSSRQWKDTATRITEKVRENLRGTVTTVLSGINTTFDAQVQSFDKKTRTHPYTPGGRDHLSAEMIAEGTSMMDVLKDAHTKNAREHFGQLQAELKAVPEIRDAFRAHYIWQRLDALDPRDRDQLLSRTDDPEVVSAVMHAPAAFPIGSDDARARMLTNFNKAHRPDKVALADDLETFLTAVDNYVDMVKRELRKVLR